MGIVAFCPGGHRVKVKDHLAGKKGICPHCGASFRIPSASEHRREDAAPAPGLPLAAVVSLDAAEAASLLPAIPLADPPVGDPAEPIAEHAASAVPPHMPGPRAVASLPRAIAEAPTAAWCWAIPGGQPSPQMSGVDMRAWLASGEVTGAELVWRSGWAEWMRVGEVFPEEVPPAARPGFPGR